MGRTRKRQQALLTRGFREQRGGRSREVSHRFVEEGTREPALHQDFLWLQG